MNKRESKKFHKLLIAELMHLGASIDKLEQDTLYESPKESSGDISSFAESGTDNFERETALHIASDETQWLNDVNEALKRIEDGTYGVCEYCETDVPVKRLEVFPSARYCVKCQAKLEKDGSL